MLIPASYSIVNFNLAEILYQGKSGNTTSASDSAKRNPKTPNNCYTTVFKHKLIRVDVAKRQLLEKCRCLSRKRKGPLLY